MVDNDIEVRYVDVGDHHKLGIVDRFVRSLREKINKYMAMYNTTKYINMLHKIIHGYNNSFHSGIKRIPAEVGKNDDDIIQLTNRKYNKAKQEEIRFSVGDQVRYILNRKQFEKNSLPKWSKMLHKITLNTEHTYTLDNGKTFKYYELQHVKNNEHITREAKEPGREQLMKENRVRRTLHKEGIEPRTVTSEKRQRKPTDRFHY